MRADYARPGAGQACTEWGKGNKLFFAHLSLLVDDKTRRELSSKHHATQDGQAGWKTVVERFELDKWNRFDALLRQLDNTVMEDGSELTEYLGEIELICDKIKAISPGYMTDFIKARAILKGLPEYFHNYAGTLYSQNPDEVDLPAICAKLKSIHGYWQARHQTGSTDMGLTTTNGKQHSNRKVEKKEKAQKEQQQPSGKKHKEKRECYECHQVGHIRRFCKVWKKKLREEREKEMKKKESVNNVEEEEDDIMVVTESDSEDANNLALAVSNKVIKFKVDSGATCHLCNDREAFSSLQKPDSRMTVTVANSQRLEVQGIGTIHVRLTDVNGTSFTRTMENVKLVPDLTHNLLSVRRLAKVGHKTTFDEPDRGEIVFNTKPSHKVMLPLVNNLYELSAELVQKKDTAYNTFEPESAATLQVWHERFGHSDKRKLIKLSKEVEGMVITDIDTGLDVVCESCLRGKFKQLPYKERTDRATKPLELVHTDVHGPSRTLALYTGHQYAINFVDDFSRYTRVYTMKTKSEALDKFKQFIAEEGKPAGIFNDKGASIRNQQDSERRDSDSSCHTCDTSCDTYQHRSPACQACCHFATEWVN